MRIQYNYTWRKNMPRKTKNEMPQSKPCGAEDPTLESSNLLGQPSASDDPEGGLMPPKEARSKSKKGLLEEAFKDWASVVIACPARSLDPWIIEDMVNFYDFNARTHPGDLIAKWQLANSKLFNVFGKIPSFRNAIKTIEEEEESPAVSSDENSRPNKGRGIEDPFLWALLMRENKSPAPPATTVSEGMGIKSQGNENFWWNFLLCQYFLGKKD